MNTSEKPTIVLVAGNWHYGSVYNPVASILRAQGYPVETVTLLSTGGPTSTTVADDAAHIQNTVLKNLIAQGKEVVLVLHSYAGVPGGDSTRGLVRRDLALQDKKGGVIALVYLAAFLLPAGQSLDSLFGGVENLLSFEGEKVTMPDPAAKFYNDLDAETTARCLAELAPYSAKPCMFTPATYEAYRDIPSTYLLCEKDASIPFDLQKAMVATAGEDLVKPTICGAGHSPMLSTPHVVFEVIDKAAKDAKADLF